MRKIGLTLAPADILAWSLKDDEDIGRKSSFRERGTMRNLWRVGAALAAVLVWCGAASGVLAQAPEALKPFVAEDAPVLVLEHVRVIDGTGDAARDDQRVVLDHGKILQVGPETAAGALPPGAK